MPLTDTVIRKILPREKPFKVTDSEGLHLLITTGGSKLWRFSYRFERRQQTISFGAYPDVSLVEARGKRLSAQRALAKGLNPSPRAQVRAAEPPDTRPTFGQIADEWRLCAERSRSALASEGRGYRRHERTSSPSKSSRSRWKTTLLFGIFSDTGIADLNPRFCETRRFRLSD